MLPLRTEATMGQKTNTCTDRRWPTFHWSPETTQAVWTHTSRHFIIKTDDEERDRTITKKNGSFSHWHRCHNPAMLIAFNLMTQTPKTTNKQTNKHHHHQQQNTTTKTNKQTHACYVCGHWQCSFKPGNEFSDDTKEVVLCSMKNSLRQIGCWA